jgi:membrane complex biogenesis BtpA family protein
MIREMLGRSPALVGVVHLLPLPGSLRWGGDIGAVFARAQADAHALRDAGFDAVIFENYGDAPFSRGFAGRGAVAAMAAVGARIVPELGRPVGVNVLRNDACSAVAVSAAIGARFIRVNVYTGAAVTDQGIVQGNALETMRAVREMAQGTAVFADVFVKHASSLGSMSLEQAARDAVERGMASALIVTGRATGAPADPEDVREVSSAVPGTPVFVGSGVTAVTASDALGAAAGVIVGSAVMVDGRAGGPIDPERAHAFVAAVRS